MSGMWFVVAPRRHVFKKDDQSKVNTQQKKKKGRGGYTTI